MRVCAIFQATPPVKAATPGQLPLGFRSGISIHAAREGGDLYQSVLVACGMPFQSTPPVKAATVYGELYYPDEDISIHAAREGGDEYKYYVIGGQYISIHAAREGGDWRSTREYNRRGHFNPRRP